MSQAAHHHPTLQESSQLQLRLLPPSHSSSPSHPTELSLFDTLHNSLVLSNVAPYLPIASLLRLGAVSRSFRALVHTTPGVFRHLDLTHVKTAQFDIDQIDHGGEVWRNVQLDENLTEDE